MKLSKEDLFRILQYERGATALNCLSNGEYESIHSFPSPTPKPLNLFLSEVLNIDFEKFYNEESYVMNEYSIKEHAMPLGNSGWKSSFIGDALGDIVFIMTHPEDVSMLSIDDVDRVANEVKKLYSIYMNMKTKQNNKLEKFKPIDGMFHHGRQVYVKDE